MKRTLVALLLVICACAPQPTEPTIRLLAYIGRDADRRIDAPDTVRANVPFDVMVYAVGSSSIECNRPDGTALQQRATLARVEGYIRVRSGAITCPSDFRYYPQKLQVRFPQAGIATIRLIGNIRTGEPATTLDSLDRTVVVVP